MKRLDVRTSSTQVGSITDVPGIRVGQVQRTSDGWLTGVTVVLPPVGTVAGVDVRGGGPGTHETDALDPRTLVPTVDAVVLTGGSAYGLVAAHGVQRWCAERGRGYAVSDVPGEVVPIVPAAAIFDLGRGGRFHCHPDEQMGYDAAVAAARSPEHADVARGNVGAGTGAAIAHQTRKGGVGTASMRLSGDLAHVVVGAIVVVNAAGSPTFPGERPLDSSAAESGSGGTLPTVSGPLSTTIAVVASNAELDPAETSRTATAAHDGMARALDPVHTMADGDTVFSLATGTAVLPGNDRRPMRVAALVELQAAAAHVLTQAIFDGVRSAEHVTTSRVDLPPWPT